jgi:membrane-anchored protein YejM (alkaline phosphatase superfamily)
MDSRNQNYFAFHFMARLTHNDLNKAGFADSIIAKLFTKFFNQNLLTNTILIFFSDHGIRFGPIRETLIGKVEERLPFMHLYIPEKWRNKYSNNLAINQNRLTTPFDIHETLMHIVRVIQR